MAMTPAFKLSTADKVFVGARISHDGQPTAQAGDLEGDAGVVDVARKAPVKISIDKVH
jgi:cytochrome c-type biogenesis protein CcmH